MYGYKIFTSRLPLTLNNMVRKSFTTNQFKQIRSYVTNHMTKTPETTNANDDVATTDGSKWPRKIFSGIQPSGELHLGNYLGTMRKWKQLQEAKEEATYCIVDMHSVTMPQEPAVLSENIIKVAATMFACGLDINKSTIFVQSAVKEHTELCWLLGSFCTMARLAHLPQYKEKTQKLRDIPLGLFIYPVLQAADIMLYKSTHVPVGEDQIQHIQLAQHIAKVFNTRYGSTFPICHAIIEEKHAARIRSLRDPLKKMSKSDPDRKSAIYLDDEPEIVLEKVKKAVTDFASDVSFDAEKRPGVSNLIAIHSNITGQTIEEIIKEAQSLDTGRYKYRVADAIIEHLKPIRDGIKTYMENPMELINFLEIGAERARYIAYDTVEEVKHKMGLGAPYLPLYLETVKQAPTSIEPNSNSTSTSNSNSNFETELANENMEKLRNSDSEKTEETLSPTDSIAAKHAKARMQGTKLASLEIHHKLNVIRKPDVPLQNLRVEKLMEQSRNRIVGKPFNIVSDITKELLSKRLLSGDEKTMKDEENIKGKLEFQEPEIRRVARCVSVVIVPPTIVAPAPKEIELTDNAIQSSETPTEIAANPSVLTETTETTTPAATATTTNPEHLTTNTNAPPSDIITQSNGGENSIHSITNLTAAIRHRTTATIKNNANNTLKRFFRTSTIMLDRKNASQTTNAHRRRNIAERIVIFAIIAIGAGFSGVYYFWRSILNAYFDTKRTRGA